jgi:hypothetical protein
MLASARSATGKYQRFAQEKVLYESLIRNDIKRAKLKKVTKPAMIRLHWIEPNAKRDPDNTRAGIKLILDSLVAQQILRGDSLSHVTGFVDTFSVEKTNPGVWVEIEEQP